MRKTERHCRNKTRKEEKQTEGNIDLAATENERALERADRRFVIPGILKADIYSCIRQVNCI